MHKFYRNNIFTNPIGWAKSIVGKTWIYRLLQGSTICYGIIFFLIFYILLDNFIDSSILPRWFYMKIIILGYLIFLTVTIVPLCYLRALRHLYLRFSDQIEIVLANKQVKAGQSKSEESSSPPT